jgi:hypothetical protein
LQLKLPLERLLEHRDLERINAIYVQVRTPDQGLEFQCVSEPMKFKNEPMKSNKLTLFKNRLFLLQHLWYFLMRLQKALDYLIGSDYHSLTHITLRL